MLFKYYLVRLVIYVHMYLYKYILLRIACPWVIGSY